MYKATLETATEVGFYDNMRKLIPAIRYGGNTRLHRAAPQSGQGGLRQLVGSQPLTTRGRTDHAVCRRPTWGGEWHPEFGPKPGDIVIKEHWAQSGFANTDLDQQLKQHGIRKVILVGFIANTCVESTGRYAMATGYHVTLVKDSTAAFSKDGMHAAHVVNAPTYAHAITATSELIAALPQKS